MMSFLQALQATKDDAVEQERERIVKALDGITKRPQKNSPAFMWADEVIAIVRGEG
jgi:hypothetical protein